MHLDPIDYASFVSSRHVVTNTVLSLPPFPSVSPPSLSLPTPTTTTTATTPTITMGLLTIIKKVKAKEKEMRLLMVGLDNAGKTTIVKRINGEDISTISPTLGFNIKTMQYQQYRLNIWDVGGQKTLRSYWRNYYEQTDGMIWVVDAADVRRLEDCREELQKLLQVRRQDGRIGEDGRVDARVGCVLE